jgi:hypothetical protein
VGEAPEPPRVLQGTDRVALSPACRYPLRSLAEWRGMRGLSSSHLGVLRFICFGENCPMGAHERTRRVAPKALEG